MAMVRAVQEWLGRPIRIVEAPRLAPRTLAGRLQDTLEYYRAGYLTAAEALAVLEMHDDQGTAPRLLRLTNSPVVRAGPWRRFKIWLAR